MWKFILWFNIPHPLSARLLFFFFFQCLDLALDRNFLELT